jgi:murein DD-endopeptidase MepM/ murein hydrolase activator NlpD
MKRLPPAVNGARPGTRRLTASLIVIGMLASASIIASAPEAAFATSYPSWSDVQKALANKNAKALEVKRIKAIIAGLDAKVTSTSAEAQSKGDAYGTAQDAYYSAAITEQSLEKQAAAAEKLRKESEQQAGQLAAQMARSGTNGFQLNLFLNGKDAASVLDGIGDGGKISERAEAVYKKALEDKNTAQALTDQANVAKAILKNLKIVAQNAAEAAQKAADAAAAALDASTQHRAELEAQLTAMTKNFKATQAAYIKGVQAQYGAGAGGSTEISSSGWARPAVGVITSGFGMRVNPVDGGYRLHTGTDIADGCNVPIYAAHSGTVTYAGWYGGLGEFIQIANGGQFGTGYGHIKAGGILVHNGEAVHVGQLIAHTGSTGEATGCHLHFMVIDNGAPINPVPFMRSQGIVLG